MRRERGTPVFAVLEVVPVEGESVAQDERQEAPPEVVGADRLRELGQAVESRQCLGAEQREHEHAVQQRKHAEVKDEERNEEELADRVHRLLRLGEEQLPHVEAADHDVLEPVEQHEGEDLPAEEQHARDRQRVREAEHEERRRHVDAFAICAALP